MAVPIVTTSISPRNTKPVIEEAMESALRQDFLHELMEAIFVDDGSKDDTFSVVESFSITFWKDTLARGTTVC